MILLVKDIQKTKSLNPMTRNSRPNMDELEELREKMHLIKTWIDAYPISVFPEPDFKKAHEVLKQHGMTLDAIAASSMRHVLEGIKDIIEKEQ